MEKKLTGEEGIKEAVAPYGPAESKLTNKLGERRLELLEATRKTINPRREDITVFYPASGPDVANALLATDAKKLILVDRDPHGVNILKEIKEIGGEVTNVFQIGNKTEFDFVWNGKNRKLIFHNLEINGESVDKLLAEVGQYDVYFEKKSQGFSSEVAEKFLTNLKVNGYTVTDFEIDSHIGFEKCKLDDKFETEQYKYGNYRMNIHRKRAHLKGMGLRMHLNKVLFDAEHLRNGGYIGIDDYAWETTFKTYREKLEELKKTFELLPAETKEEVEEKSKVREEIINRLFNAKGEMSKVHNSPENLEKQLQHLIEKRALSFEAHELFVSRIREAYESPNRPTEQQLERFIEEGKKVFKEVFPEWV
ncbi:MAG: hypothetical protein QXF56_02905 [Candidatus Micrarchaeia archaeon]